MGWDVRHVMLESLDRLVRPFERGEITDTELLESIGKLLSSAEYRAGFATLGGPFDPQRQALSDVVSTIAAEMSDVRTPVVELDRRFGQLRWALDELGLPADLVKSAVHGSTELVVVNEESGDSRKVVGGAGFPMRVSPPAACGQVNQLLSSVKPADLHDVIDFARMRDDSVYETSRFDGEEERLLVVHDFENLRSLYQVAAATDRSVLVITG